MPVYSFEQGLVNVPPKRDMTRSLLLLPVDEISPNPAQPRKEFSQEQLHELMISIAQVGLIQPLTVRSAGGGYELISGERRLRACRLLGMKEVPCVLQNVGEEKSALMALVENVQRSDLHYLEEAESYQALLVRFGLSQEALCQRLGKSQAFLSNKLRLLKLPCSVRDVLRGSACSERHARALLKLTEESEQLKVLSRILKEGWTVAETEDCIERMLAASEKKPLRILRLTRDCRLFLNGIKASIEQLRQSGMEAQLEEEKSEGELKLIIRIKT